MPTGTSDEGQVYCDASALVKLIVPEPESGALRAFLGRQRIATTELALVEVPCAIRRLRLGEVALARAGALFESVELVAVTPDILARAGNYREPKLRSLDAIHVSSAEGTAASNDHFVSYDRRQVQVAAAAGLDVRSPA